MENKYIAAYRSLKKSLPSDKEIRKIAEELGCPEDEVQNRLIEQVKDDPEYLLWKGTRQDGTKYACNAFFADLIDVLFNNLGLLDGPHSEALASFYTTVADALGFVIIRTPEYAKHRALIDLLFNAAELAEKRGSITDCQQFRCMKQDGRLGLDIDYGHIADGVETCE